MCAVNSSRKCRSTVDFSVGRPIQIIHYLMVSLACMDSYIIVTWNNIAGVIHSFFLKKNTKHGGAPSFVYRNFALSLPREVQDVAWEQIHINTVLRFVCVEVLRPSQPNGVTSSVVCLPNHTFTGQT